MDDHAETLLMSIDKTLDSIDASLQDQFSSVDGVNYAAKQAWMRIVEIRDTTATIRFVTSLTFLLALATAIAVVAHIIHHW
jgi:hypothetical protein